MNERVGIFGGTFDPIHYGHLNAAAQAASTLDLDRVLFVPTGLPWQKTHAPRASGADRFTMCLLATADNPRFHVSRIEIDRPGPSYTADTLSALRSRIEFAAADLYCIVGADALAGISTWHDYPEFLSSATFVGVTRPGHPLDVDGQVGAFRLLSSPGIDISSSMIRRRVFDRDSIDYLTPWPVVAYIRKYGIYSDDGEVA